MVERIVLLGAGGQLGRELARVLPALGELHAFDRSGCDLSELDAAIHALKALKPSLIVNAAAYTAVDKAETEQVRAFALNADAPRALAQLAARLDARLVHYSTDYVFDGTKAGEYLETDACAPQSVYGASKLIGEQSVLAYERSLVFRLSWVFGAAGANFPKTMIRLARERPELRVVADQRGRPCPARLAAELTVAALRGNLRGLYQLCGAQAVTWHELAELSLGYAGLTSRVLPITTAEYPTPAKRPANSVMSTAKLEAALGMSMPSWQPYLKTMIEECA